MSDLLYDERIKRALEPIAHGAPKGMESLAKMSDELIIQMLTHTDSVRPVWTTRYITDLPGVDEGGYSVYDETMTLSHRCVVDPNNPDADLSVPQRRTMNFGLTLEDINFMWNRKHGDVFYIHYNTGKTLPRVILCVVFDPLKS